MIIGLRYLQVENLNLRGSRVAVVYTCHDSECTMKN